MAFTGGSFMSDDEAFVQAMLERPEDESVRLVYADWLEERGDARAELLRLQHALSRAIKPPQRKKLERRLQCLLVAGVGAAGPFITNSIGMEFALIPAGNFRMGSPRGEKDRRREENQHLVEITQPFFMGNHTVTTQQFRAFVNGAKYQTAAENKHGEGGWGFNEKDRRFEGPGLEYTWQNTGWAQSDAHPVVNVTWNDAVAFCE